jgi:hypothetical protein
MEFGNVGNEPGRREKVAEFLRLVAKSRTDDGPPRNAPELLLRHGSFWSPQALPAGVRRGLPRECFKNATELALLRPHLRYCEGIAMPARLNLPVEHAWCVDAHGGVVDITWENPESCVYFGLPFAREFVWGTAMKTGECGILRRGEEFRKLLLAAGTMWPCSPLSSAGGVLPRSA